METKPTEWAHRPGPWKIEESKFTINIVAGNESIAVTQAVGKTTRITNAERANARLIAAAPLQHDTLQAIVNDCTAWLNEEMELPAHELLVAIQEGAENAIQASKA